MLSEIECCKIKAQPLPKGVSLKSLDQDSRAVGPSRGGNRHQGETQEASVLPRAELRLRRQSDHAAPARHRFGCRATGAAQKRRQGRLEIGIYTEFGK